MLDTSVPLLTGSQVHNILMVDEQEEDEDYSEGENDVEDDDHDVDDIDHTNLMDTECTFVSIRCQTEVPPVRQYDLISDLLDTDMLKLYSD